MTIKAISSALPLNPLKSILDKPMSQGLGKALLSGGLPTAPLKGADFATVLQKVLKAGGTDALDLQSQLTLGGDFLSQMSEAEAGKLAQTTDLNALLDSLDGVKNTAGLDMASLLGGAGIPGAGKGLDMNAVMQALQGNAANQDNAAASSPTVGSSKSAHSVASTDAITGPKAPEFSDPVQHVAPPQGPQAAEAPQAAQAPQAAKAPEMPQWIDAPKSAGWLTPSLGAEASKPQSLSLRAANKVLAQRAYGQAEASESSSLLGALSARFESGGNASAVGWDRTGGTSYGIYQIASRTGTFDSFLQFLDREAPDIASRLRAAGPADTGSKVGAMPAAWKTVAHDNSERFAGLQHKFIQQTHYQPALKKVAELSGIDLTGTNKAVGQALWSTAVQHGPTGSARIFAKALESVGDAKGPGFERELIEAVYANRANQFGSSTSRVQSAVKDRFSQEMKAVLSTLGGASQLDSSA